MEHVHNLQIVEINDIVVSDNNIITINFHVLKSSVNAEHFDGYWKVSKQLNRNDFRYIVRDLIPIVPGDVVVALTHKVGRWYTVAPNCHPRIIPNRNPAIIRNGLSTINAVNRRRYSDPREEMVYKQAGYKQLINQIDVYKSMIAARDASAQSAKANAELFNSVFND